MCAHVTGSCSSVRVLHGRADTSKQNLPHNSLQHWSSLLQAAAERERQKAQAAASAERAAFEAQEARMAAELEQRTQQERRLLEEAAQRARQAAEERRRCALLTPPSIPINVCGSMHAMTSWTNILRFPCHMVIG